MSGDEEEHDPRGARHRLRPRDDDQRRDPPAAALDHRELDGLGEGRPERQQEPGQTRSTRDTPLASSAARIAATSSAEGGSTGGRTSALRKMPRQTMPAFMRA